MQPERLSLVLPAIPAALECAMDVWGRSDAVIPHPPLECAAPEIDEDTLRAAAKKLGILSRRTFNNEDSAGYN